MLYSKEWLQEYSSALPENDVLEHELTTHAVEVEEIIETAPSLDGVRVGEVLKVWKHPDADSLHIGLFDVGDVDENGDMQPRQIVFGLKAELPIGSKLPIACAPTVLPGGVKIKKSKLRGEKSFGMCCLNSEIGILNRADEVHFFEADVKNGTPIMDVLPIAETLIDIDNKSMTNRSDLFSHANMAREIAAVFGHEYIAPELKPLPEGLPELDVVIEDTESCTRYIGMELNVKVGPSPEYIQRRLQACGIKVINNVVDITNYVMLELGEPMHAFDADKVDGGIVVRRAKKGESITTLDKDTKELAESVLVIADHSKPVAVAGVIGGLESGVVEDTTRIILEAAHFEPLQVRKAGQHIGVRTDSLLRWEKGISPEMASRGMQRAVELLMEYADGEPVAYSDVYPVPAQQETIEVSQHSIDRFAGMHIESTTIIELLERLECTVSHTGDTYSVTVPYFRTDLHIAEDIVEEIIRLYGIDNIPVQPLEGRLVVPQREANLELADDMRDTLVQLGGYEVMRYSFYGEELAQQVGAADLLNAHIEIENPLSEDLRYLRPMLFPRLMEGMAVDARLQEECMHFEVGHVYTVSSEDIHCGVLNVGKENTVRTTRGMIEQLLDDCVIDYETQVVPATDLDIQFWAPWYGQTVLQYSNPSSGAVIAVIGKIQPLIASTFGIESEVAYALVSVDAAVDAKNTDETVNLISPYPAITLDLSVIVDENVQWSAIEEVVRRTGKELLQSVQVFDVYTGEELGEGKKSIAFQVVMQSQKETLKMKKMEQWRDKQLMGALEKTIGAELRGK